MNSSPASRLEYVLLSSSFRTSEALRGARLIQETEKELELEKELEEERLEVERLQNLERLEAVRLEQERLAMEKEIIEKELETQRAKEFLLSCEPIIDVEADELSTLNSTTNEENEKDEKEDKEGLDKEASDGPINSALDTSLFYSNQQQEHESALQQLMEAANRHELAARKLEELSLQIGSFFSRDYSAASGSRAETFARFGDLLLSMAEEELDFEYNDNVVLRRGYNLKNDGANNEDNDEDNGKGSPGPQQRDNRRRNEVDESRKVGRGVVARASGGGGGGRGGAQRKEDYLEEKYVRATPLITGKRENRQTPRKGVVSGTSTSKPFSPPLSSINVAAAHSALLSTDRSARTMKEAQMVKSSLEVLRPIRIVVPTEIS